MRAVVIGIDGVIGKALYASLNERGHTVLGTTRRTGEVDGRDRFFLDLSLSKLPSIPSGDVVIFCAAMSRFADCRNLPEQARQVNVTAPLDIAKEFVQRGADVLMLSSSVVLDCLSPPAKIDRVLAPRSAYGRTKAEAEAGILALGGSVLRLTKVVTAQSGLLADWINALDRGERVQALEDHRFCPIKIDSVFEAVAAIIERKCNGIFQLSGTEDISYADAARHLADRLSIPRNRIEGKLAVEMGIPKDEVTRFTSLDSARLIDLIGYRPLPPRAVIDDVFAWSFATARAR